MQNQKQETVSFPNDKRATLFTRAAWLRSLKPGDSVSWNDPDEGISSGVYTIFDIKTECGTIVSEADAVFLQNAAGSAGYVDANELVPANVADDETWLGSPAPEAPDTWWILDGTGLYVRLEDGQQFAPSTAKILIWSDKDIQQRLDDDLRFDPEVVRLENAVVGLLLQGALERPEFADSLAATRKEVQQAADGTLAWEPDYPVGSSFNSELSELLDELCVCARHPSAAGKHIEEVDFLAGRIGSMAVQSVLSVYANGEEAAVAGFTAQPCESPEAAMAKAKAWAVEEAMEHTAESMRMALSFAGRVRGWPLGQSMCELADAAESAAHQLFLGKAPDEEALTAFFAQRIEDGEWDDDDIPSRMARFGLQSSTSFLAEIQERMGNAKADAEADDED